jgi:MerR family transcriptional regulator, copper efflux regulator
MRITEAARRLGMSPRMLRYRDSLGLLPGLRTGLRTGGGPARPHRQFSELDLAAVSLGLAIERRYNVTPAALAFGLRVLAEPGVRAEVAELGRRIGRVQAPAARALDFEQERALRLLSMQRRPGREGERR